MPDKKSLIYFIILTIIAALTGVALYLEMKKEIAIIPEQFIQKETIEQVKIDRQFRELEELRQQKNLQPLSEEEIRKQFDELNKLHSQIK